MKRTFQGLAQTNPFSREVLIIDENRSATLLKPERSQRVKNHSPDGFNWGYAASGPAQLAKQEIHNCESSFSNFST